MTNTEAIKTLTKLGYFLRSYIHAYEKATGNASKIWEDIVAIDMAVTALKAQDNKTKIEK